MNDRDGFVANFFRALQAEPDTVAHYAEWPVNENDLHARHVWLVQRRSDLTARLEGDPDYYDAKIAGWWCWGLCCWIGSGWCSGNGPWQSVDGKRVHLGNAGRGVHRKRVHLGDAGQGVHRKRVHLGDAGQGEAGIHAWMQALAKRLRRVRVCCGDWTRVLGPSVTTAHGLTGVVLDPPYSHADRDETLYAVDEDISAHVRVWALEHGADPRFRIVLCGYDTEHALPGWRQMSWTANGGMSNQNRNKDNQNKYRETLSMSPHCLDVHHQPTLFGGC